MDPLSLYLHIPFCRHRCSYCDFNTYTTLTPLQGEYVVALEKEIAQVAELAESKDQLRAVETLFFGGGTPSLLTIEQVKRLLRAVQSTFGFTPDAEISLEANPDTVDGTYLSSLREIGINRLSFGMQSAEANELTLLGRTHDYSTVVTALHQAHEAGIKNLNLDLIFGLPAQDLVTWERNLEAALVLQPSHLSLYCLTIEPGTPMQRWLQNGRIAVPDPDLAASQYELACNILAQAGFTHYEISNWSKPGFECRHNLTYWRDHEYLGMGAGAHGKVSGYRYETVRRPRVYIRRMAYGKANAYPLSAAVSEAHELETREAMSDRVITQLRLLQEGLDLALFKSQFGQTLDDAYDGLVGQLEDWDLLRRDGSRLLLTDRGKFISNQVFYRFM